MRIRIQQINVTVGDLAGNTRLILKALKDAEKSRVDLLILPELVTCGYPPMDLLERKSFIESIQQSNEEIIGASGRTALLFGSVRPNPLSHGRPVCNCALMVQHGKLLHEVQKTLLPTYDVFDEFRYFEPAREVRVVEWGGRKWGITICEDIWNNQNEYNYHTYDVEPADLLKEQGAEVLVNISASPFTRRKLEMREDMLIRHSSRLKLPVIYANQTGANTELIFDGSSCVIPSGSDRPVLRLAALEEDAGDVIWDDDGSFRLPEPEGRPLKTHSPEPDVRPVSTRLPEPGISPVRVFPGPEERLFKALVLGLKDYVAKSRMTGGVLLGLSGGIDSALTAAIAVEALGPDRVTGITMPSPYSSKESVDDSFSLARNLGITCHELSIETAFNHFRELLEPLFAGRPFDVAEENIQSRCRGILLMALSNKLGHMVLNTGNKSELAVGYCTLYGDMAGGLSVLSDLYKTEVYAVSRWLNSEYYGRVVIPLSTLEKPPSAELRPDQKDTDSLPEYELLDAVLQGFIEDHRSADELIASGLPEETVTKVIRMVDGNEYKRRQAPPGLRVSSKAFGSGRRLPLAHRWDEMDR